MRNGRAGQARPSLRTSVITGMPAKLWGSRAAYPKRSSQRGGCYDQPSNTHELKSISQWRILVSGPLANKTKGCCANDDSDEP